MLRETGFCSGVENYSRHLARRAAGSTPWTLLDYFPDDFLLFVDESHMTIPQVRGMFNSDRARKDVLVELRLPPAVGAGQPAADVPPSSRSGIGQAVYVSATPGPYEQRAQRAGRRAADPSDRPARPEHRGQADQGPDRRPDGADRAARSAAASGRW